jgi:hypothetical protein
MKRRTPSIILLCTLALASAGCAHAHSTVASVDIMAIEQRWPKFINYSRQLQANYLAISESKISADDKRKALLQWQQQSARWQDEVTGDVRDAVKQIATNEHYQLVVTRQGTFGGDDITIDVEKALKIDTSGSPPPSQ